jgi:thioredoxin 1
MPRHVEKVTDHEFQQKVIGSGEPVLVDFYADWCGPCKRLAPVLDELAQETPDARIVKIDIDRSPKVAAHYGVRSIPTLILFKDGKPVTRRTGLSSKASLKELLAQ